MLTALEEERLRDEVMVALDISQEEASSVLLRHAIRPNDQVDDWMKKYNEARKTWNGETGIEGLRKIIEDIELKHDGGRSMSSDGRHSSASTQENPLFARRNQRAARLTNDREIPDSKEKFHQDPLTVQISDETVITRYETRETQTETPLESDIEDEEPCSCEPARATCWEDSGKTWQDHILKCERCRD
jgi:hypothetical protein